MALTNEELEQIRFVVRNEMTSSRSGRWWLWLFVPGIFTVVAFFAVLALHVLVIGGFTVYHLMASGGWR